MLQEIDQFNKYVFMKGFEKTQLLRGLEVKLHDFVKYAKFELGMGDLQYHVNFQNLLEEQYAEDEADKKDSILSGGS